MSHLSLCVTTNNLKGFTFINVLFLLLLCPHILNTLHKHGKMHGAWALKHLTHSIIDKVRISHPILHIIINNWHIFNSLLNNFFSLFVKNIKIMRWYFISIQCLFQFCVLFNSIQELWYFLWVKFYVSSFGF